MKSNFTEKLHTILNRSEYNHIIRWYEDGAAFIILNMELLQNVIFPEWFTHNHFSSFAKQLQNYGFVRITSIKGTKAYIHQLFEFHRDLNPRLIRHKQMLKKEEFIIASERRAEFRRMHAERLSMELQPELKRQLKRERGQDSNLPTEDPPNKFLRHESTVSQPSTVPRATVPQAAVPQESQELQEILMPTLDKLLHSVSGLDRPRPVQSISNIPEITDENRKELLLSLEDMSNEPPSSFSLMGHDIGISYQSICKGLNESSFSNDWIEEFDSFENSRASSRSD